MGSGKSPTSEAYGDLTTDVVTRDGDHAATCE